MKKIITTILFTTITIFAANNIVKFQEMQFKGKKEGDLIYFNTNKVLENGNKFASCVLSEDNGTIKNIICLKKGEVNAEGAFVDGIYINGKVTIFTPLIEMEKIDISKIIKQ